MQVSEVHIDGFDGGSVFRLLCKNVPLLCYLADHGIHVVISMLQEHFRIEIESAGLGLNGSLLTVNSFHDLVKHLLHL